MSMLEKSFWGPQSFSRNSTPVSCITWTFIPRKNLVIENVLLTQNTCTVKLGDKEQIGVKEPFSVTNCQFTS